MQIVGYTFAIARRKTLIVRRLLNRIDHIVQQAIVPPALIQIRRPQEVARTITARLARADTLLRNPETTLFERVCWGSYGVTETFTIAVVQQH